MIIGDEKMTKFVSYQRKNYKVLANKHLGDFRQYKLASRHEDGSPFGALKEDCKKAK